LEDDQLKLPWELGIFKAIFSDEPTVSLLPTQVLSEILAERKKGGNPPNANGFDCVRDNAIR